MSENQTIPTCEHGVPYGGNCEECSTKEAAHGAHQDMMDKMEEARLKTERRYSEYQVNDDLEALTFVVVSGGRVEMDKILDFIAFRSRTFERKFQKDENIKRIYKDVLVKELQNRLEAESKGIFKGLDYDGTYVTISLSEDSTKVDEWKNNISVISDPAIEYLAKQK